MSFPNANVSDLVATTIDSRSPDIADNVTAQNAVLNFISKQGNVVTFSGGVQIQENFSFAENANGGSYSGADELPIGSSDVISGAKFSISQYAVPVMFTGLEADIQNAGKEALIDLVEARVAVAESTMENILNRHLYLDGTGNNGKNLTGLAAAVSSTPTNTYGGIDRNAAAYAFWKNLTFTATTNGAGAKNTTGAQVLADWNKFIIDLTRGKDRPNVIVAGPALYALFESGLQANQRFTNAEAASAGFRSIDFQGIPVIPETTAGGINTDTAYFLNTKYLKWRPHANRNMTTLKDKQAVNQDATVKTLVWAGNLTCSGSKFNGYYKNV